MTERAPRRPNPQEWLVGVMRETARPDFVPYSWTGSRVPERLAIPDPTDPERKRLLVDIPVGYMRDGMMFGRDSRPIGSYERIIDHLEQPDGSMFNALLLYPINLAAFGAAVIRRHTK